MAELKKQLTVKTNAVKRLLKEYDMYQKEVEKEEAALRLLAEKNADSSQIRQQENVVNESKMMVGDTKNRLFHFSEELRNVVDDAGAKAFEEEIILAQQMLEKVASME
eukprot:GCRY01000757.1.p1 GENE.GCRY01000757.1~~GCRY01000757.1.p1  ORF type:complete len:108 (+),score=32.00 GCRY01000757.1:144-467(+)